jgi:hypothetical protein
MTLVSKNYCSEAVLLDTNLEAVAIRMYFPFKFTICNEYLRGTERISRKKLYDLIGQLEPPFMLLGDMNGRNFLWGSGRVDNRGVLIEDIINWFNLSILNHGNPTHCSYAYRTFSAIDLTLISPILNTYFDWYVEDDLFNSDHFPIIIPIKSSTNINQSRERWFIKEADWVKYQNNLNFSDLREVPDNIDIHVLLLSKNIQLAANNSIPKAKTHLYKNPVP